MAWSGLILIIASVVIVNATHYHFQLYGKEASVLQPSDSMLNSHLEQAIIQSVILTVTLALILASLMSIYLARRISKPLVQMKQAALTMSEGEWSVRSPTNTQDEMADLGKALNTLAEQLQKQQELRQSMTENIAHELRTPLATLKSMMIAIGDGIWEPTKERIESCQDEIDRLIYLVSDLEQLNEMASPDFKLEKSEFEFIELLEKIVRLNEAAFTEKKVELRLRMYTKIRVYWDENRMTQVINNLLSNALKFTPSGGTVHIAAQEDTHRVILSIQDTGIGIPEKDRSLIFERFYRVDKSRSRKTGGKGLGLAIAKSIVEAHGGRIWVKKVNEDKGMTIIMNIPRKKNHDAELKEVEDGSAIPS